MAAFVRAYYDGKLDPGRVNQKFLDRAMRALTRYYGDATERALRKAARRIRPLDSYFDWPTKPTKELGVVRQIIESVGEPLTFRAVHPGVPNSTPDFIGERPDGTLVAIEVTELLDRKLMNKNVTAIKKGRPEKVRFRAWEGSDLIAAIDERLKAKDGKELKGGEFPQYVVVLHTDEKMLAHADAEGWLQDQTFAGMRQVTEAYVLFSYDGKGYPYIRLRVST